MNPPSLEELHADPANWKLGLFYFCRADHRAVVPKRISGLGWTINFARPSAYVWIVGLSLFVWGTVALARSAGADRGTLMIVKLALFFGVVIFCHRAANRSAGPKP